VERAITRFQQFEADRTEWLTRREAFYLGWDDYLTPTRKGPWAGSSNLHLPMTEIQCNAMHARLMQAFFFLEPWFFVDPQEELDMERIQKIELTMKYILMRYANFNKGIYFAIDDWAWDIVTDGMGILSRDWSTVQRRFITVEENQKFKQQKVDLQKLLEDTNEKEFEATAKKLIKYPYIEKSIIRTVHNCPVVVAEDPTYILFKGQVVDCTDLNAQETVIKVCYFTKDQLIGFKQSQYMDEDVVDEILESKPTPKGSSMASSRTSRLEHMKDRTTGIKTQGASVPEETYEFLCMYDRVAIEQAGKQKKDTLADELVYLVNTNTKKLARWTFLDRISSTGKRPLHMAHLYRRPRRAVGRGMVETQWPLNETSDLLINQSIDAGLIANNPMFGFRGNSTFDPGEVRMEPGIGFKMDDPNNDLRFFTWPVNPNWSTNVQGLIQSFSSQLTSLGPLSMGQVGSNVGPLRSNAGAQTLLGETGTNLDVLLKRVKIPYAEFMEGIYMDCMDRMPDKLLLSVMGQDGEPMMDEEGRPTMLNVSKEELKARVHFGIYANSQNMNKSAMEAAAMKQAQFLLQRVAIESGVVRPENIYEILLNVVRTQGTQRSYRFLSKPQNQIALPYSAEILMIMQGLKPQVVLNDREHQMKIDQMTELLNSEKAALEIQYGYVNKNAMKLLESTIAEHQRFLETLQQPTNLKNPTGSNVSPTLGQQDGAVPSTPQGDDLASAGAGEMGPEQ